MINMAAGILIKNGRILLAKKIELGNMADKWELPGGKFQPGETPEQCLVRYLRDKFGINVKVGDLFGENVYEYGSNDIKVMVHLIDWDGEEWELASNGDVQWANLDEIMRYEFTFAHVPIIEEIINKGLGSQN